MQVINSIQLVLAPILKIFALYILYWFVVKLSYDLVFILYLDVLQVSSEVYPTPGILTIRPGIGTEPSLWNKICTSFIFDFILYGWPVKPFELIFFILIMRQLFSNENRIEALHKESYVIFLILMALSLISLSMKFLLPEDSQVLIITNAYNPIHPTMLGYFLLGNTLYYFILRILLKFKIV